MYVFSEESDVWDDDGDSSRVKSCSRDDGGLARLSTLLGMISSPCFRHRGGSADGVLVDEKELSELRSSSASRHD